MVLFRVWLICLLVVGSYVCKLVYQSVGWGLCLVWVCLFVGWWLCDSIISLTLGMVLVLDFFITDLNQFHGFQATNGQIIGHIWSSFIYFLCMCVVYLY